MGLYKIELKSSSEQDLKRIDKQNIPKILDAIESLGNNPFPINSKKLRSAELTYRLRIGDYRIIYQVDRKNKVIIIYHIRHRKEAYKR